MTTVVEQRLQDPKAVQIIADFSPPRGTDPSLLDDARYLDADFIAVAYNPGKSARVNSAFTAAWIKQNTGKDVTFSISTRDMNKVAIQSMLMGAELAGLENVVVLKGDSFTEKELTITKPVDDYIPTGLIRAITEMNERIDYKGLKLRNPTSFCVGATIDLGFGVERQIELTRKKVKAGAQYFLLQALFYPERLAEFVERYAERYGEELNAPIYCGVQVMVEDSVVFGDIPDWVTSGLDRGRSGVDIALELAEGYRQYGVPSIYLVAPILKGGRRDYEAAQQVIEAIRSEALDVEQTEEAGRAQLAGFRASYSNLDEWKARAKTVRHGILDGAKLSPLPSRTPLNPILHSRREYDGYSVENVAFESLPGFFVTGNLYRPLGIPGPYAGVLCPHGHFNELQAGRFREDMQMRCATFARMGAITFAYDMVGWGDSKQCRHKQPKSLKLQLWNSIRATDFLTSLDEVDPERIAVTGASGGATQGLLVTAVDDRVSVSVPVVMVSSRYSGGCKCEGGLPILKSEDHETNNVDIAALAAPRPQLILSDGEDFTSKTPDIEFPYVQSVYELYGAADNVENVHFPDEGHDYGPSKRAAVYPFFANHLGLDAGMVDETAVQVEHRSSMRVFTAEHPRPDHAKDCSEIV
jgi:5,10-methylenetetrahydrofolate reductase